MAKHSETGWLLELQIGGRAVWWRAHVVCGRAWTTDANEAVRFARKEDALRVRNAMRYILDDYDWSEAEATEHMWCPPIEDEPDGRCVHCGVPISGPGERMCAWRESYGNCENQEK